MNTIERVKADLIDFAWRKWLSNLQNILDVGAALLKAKEAIPHGEFLDAVSSMPFSEDTAQRLMAIARHPVLSKTDWSRYLPPSWQTLYELTRAPLPVLQRALEAGEITPDLKEHQARKLWRESSERDRGALYAIFACASCGARKLHGDESRPSVLGEDAEARPRLYECDSCGKTTLTEERVIGPFGKKSLPKAGKSPVDGERVTIELPREPQTGTR